MKILIAAFLCLYCVGRGSTYIFPICTADGDKTCLNYFSLPNFATYFNFNQDEEIVEEKSTAQYAAQAIFEAFNSLWSQLNNCYDEIVDPVISKTQNTITNSWSFLQENCSRLWKNIPIFKRQEKARADSRLYFLFIVLSLTIYMALYIYFTKKLFYFYQNRLRNNYLDNIRRFFKKKEKE